MGAAGQEGHAHKQDQALRPLSSPEFPALPRWRPTAGSFIFSGGAEVSPGARRKSLLTQTFLIVSRKTCARQLGLRSAGCHPRGVQGSVGKPWVRAGKRLLRRGSVSGWGPAPSWVQGHCVDVPEPLARAWAALCVRRWPGTSGRSWPRHPPCTPGCSVDLYLQVASPNPLTPLPHAQSPCRCWELG